MKDWTLLDDARLLALLSKGWTRKKIAADFGVTRNAICGRVHRLVYKPPAVDQVMPEVEISFEDVLEAEPMFEPPVASIYAPYPWRVGQRVTIENVRAFVNGERRFEDWSGTGTIDMIQYGGQCVRVVAEPYYAWVDWKNFDRMKFAPFTLDELLAGTTEENLHGEVDFGPAVGEEFPNQEPALVART